MKPILVTLASLLVATSCMASAAENGLPLSQIIAQIKHDIEVAQNTPGKQVGLKLSTVEVNLAVSSVTVADGSTTLGLPFLDTGVRGQIKQVSEHLSLVSVVLSPPEPKVLLDGSSNVGTRLAKTIVDLREQLAKGVDDEPKLNPKEAKISISFGITQDQSAKGDVEFLVFSADAGISGERAQSSAVILTFRLDPAP